MPDIFSSSSGEFSASRPRILFVNTYYDAFLEQQYRQDPQLAGQTYTKQLSELQATGFGDSDFYSRGIAEAGWEAADLIVNAPYLQLTWARENGCDLGDSRSIMLEQIRRYRPDVIYLQDLSLAVTELLDAMRPFTTLICGQIASPLPTDAHLAGLDLIFSSFPHFVERFRQQGHTAYYQPLAFEPRILEQLPTHLDRNIRFSFIGGISPYHGKSTEVLEKIASSITLDVWGYGASTLAADTALLRQHHGEAWGLKMFKLLASSRITLNRHIDVAENHANNMRLFEATGCGALLLTDYRDNLDELFEIGKEVVAYRSPEEAVMLAHYYQHHPTEANSIALAGRERTLRDHTYKKRMLQTSEILLRHLRHKETLAGLPALDSLSISTNYQPLSPADDINDLSSAWESPLIPKRQRNLVEHELEAMYKGATPIPYRVLAELLKSVITPGMSILEIGCASGYYKEVLEYLLTKQINYWGVDISEAMINLAKTYYPSSNFSRAEATRLPFRDQSFPLVISGCVLLHDAGYIQQIAETCRIAKTWVAAHRTPTCRTRPTVWQTKCAYGVKTVELRFNQEELLDHFSQNSFELKHTVIYSVDANQDEYEASFLFLRKQNNTALN